jgi:hypothetical protein
MLAMIRAKAMGTIMCMEPTETGKRSGKTLIIAPCAGLCRSFPAALNAMPEHLQ